MKQSSYIKDIRSFARKASKCSSKAGPATNATRIFFKHIAKNLKHTGAGGSRTWAALTYTNAIKAGVSGSKSRSKPLVLTADKDLNVCLNYGKLKKKKRPDIIIARGSNLSIIEIKSSATLNAILSAGGEFAIIKRLGRRFDSQHLKAFHPRKVKPVNFILFSGFSDRSYDHDIYITRKALAFNFSEVSWFKNGASQASGDWTEQDSFDAVKAFFRILLK